MTASKKTTEEQINDFRFSVLLLTARQESQRLLVGTLVQKLRLSEPDLADSIWREEQKAFARLVDELLAAEEDRDSGFAAKYHEKVDAIRKAMKDGF